MSHENIVGSCNVIETFRLRQHPTLYQNYRSNISLLIKSLLIILSVYFGVTKSLLYIIFVLYIKLFEGRVFSMFAVNMRQNQRTIQSSKVTLLTKLKGKLTGIVFFPMHS